MNCQSLALQKKKKLGNLLVAQNRILQTLYTVIKNTALVEFQWQELCLSLWRQDRRLKMSFIS